MTGTISEKADILSIKFEQKAKIVEHTTSYAIYSRQFADTKPVDNLAFGIKRQRLTDVVVTAPSEPSLIRA